MKNLCCFATLFLLTVACAPKAPEPSGLRQKIDGSVDALITLRTDSSGTWDDAGWWNSANILTALVRYAELTGEREKVLPVIDDVFRRAPAQAKDFVNDYYDDEGWWVLAWIDAYNLTGKTEYLEMAKVTFADMTGGWSDECGGGIWWRKPNHYKNAIANNLFTLSAARLFRATSDRTYEDWFRKNTAWFLGTGMFNPQTGLIEDGLHDCIPNQGQYHTYNQGVALAALAEMYLLTDDPFYLETATTIADSTISRMVTPEGILTERYEPNLGADGIQFKGIFMRHLGFLYGITRDPAYAEFIMRNAQSIMENNYDPGSGTFGGLWYGPFDALHTGGNSSALECLLEAYNVTLLQDK